MFAGLVEMLLQDEASPSADTPAPWLNHQLSHRSATVRVTLSLPALSLSPALLDEAEATAATIEMIKKMVVPRTISDP